MFHYTNLETIIKILQNKRIRFNRLDRVDDLTESTRLTNSSFAKYYFVSCWANQRNENISLWQMYSKNMEGFCISLPKFPFVFIDDNSNKTNMKDILKRSKEKPQIAFRYQPATVFDLCNESGKYLSNYIICQHGKLLLNEFLLNMDYKKDFSDSNVSPFYEFSFDDNDKHEMMYSKKVAREKHKDWAFQNESRYCIVFTLSDERFCWGNEEKDIKQIYASNSGKIFDFVDVAIDNYYLSKMKIIAGPKCKDSDIETVKTVLQSEKLSNISITKSFWTDKIKI